MTTANSAIFSSSIFGNSSGNTAVDLSTVDTTTQEKYFAQGTAYKIENTVPSVPSNQHVAKDN
tara:strand:- start:108 stop:296 length:189 start_codon:yes stop_codon:yes gene_type:complete